MRLLPSSLCLSPRSFLHTYSPLLLLPQFSSPGLYLGCFLPQIAFPTPTMLCTYSNPASCSPLPQHLVRVCSFPEYLKSTKCAYGSSGFSQPCFELVSSWAPSGFSGNLCRTSTQCPRLAYNEEWPESCQAATVLSMSPVTLWKMETFQSTRRGSKGRRV